MVMSPGSSPPGLIGSLSSLQMITATDPANWAFFTLSTKLQVPLSTNVIEPVWSFVNVLHPNNGSATLMPLSRISSLSCGPKADLYKVYVPAAPAGEAILNTITSCALSAIPMIVRANVKASLLKIVKLFIIIEVLKLM